MRKRFRPVGQKAEVMIVCVLKEAFNGIAFELLDIIPKVANKVRHNVPRLKTRGSSFYG